MGVFSASETYSGESEMSDTKPTLEVRITQYLKSGGLFNPELATHDAVRDLLIDCRKELAALRLELARLDGEIPSGH